MEGRLSGFFDPVTRRAPGGGGFGRIPSRLILDRMHFARMGEWAPDEEVQTAALDQFRQTLEASTDSSQTRAAALMPSSEASIPQSSSSNATDNQTSSSGTQYASVFGSSLQTSNSSQFLFPSVFGQQTQAATSSSVPSMFSSSFRATTNVKKKNATPHSCTTTKKCVLSYCLLCVHKNVCVFVHRMNQNPRLKRNQILVPKRNLSLELKKN